MPFSFNGIGTAYHGNRDKESDGSYVTTSWFMLLFFPVIPLGSYRVRPTGENHGINLGIYSHASVGYVVRRVPLNLRQVRNVYLAFYGWLVALLAFVLFIYVCPLCLSG